MQIAFACRFARIVTSVITLNLVTFGESIVDCVIVGDGVGDEENKDFDLEQSRLMVAEQFNVPATGL